MKPLSHAEQCALRHAARDKRGIIEHPMKMSNFDKPERRMEKLTGLGLLVPSGHGGWFITDAGREWVSTNPV